jgi:hypothetical protein
MLTEVLHKASQVAAESVANLGREALNIPTGAAKEATDKAAARLEEATKGIGDLLKKK